MPQLPAQLPCCLRPCFRPDHLQATPGLCFNLTPCRIVKQRTAAQRLQGAADPLVSFLGLAQQLTRSEAVKLFVQVRAL